MPPTPVLETPPGPRFSLKFCIISEGKKSPPGGPGRSQDDQMCTKGLQNGSKREVRHPLNRRPRGDPAKKGAMSNPYSICYVLTTSALPEKVTFSLQWAPQSEGKIRSATEVAKKRRKRGAKGAEEKQRGGTWRPKGRPGSPK